MEPLQIINFLAFGTELGIEVDNEIIEIEGPVIEAVVNEDNNEIIDASSEKESDDNNVDDASEDVELLTPDFDCPAAGLYPSPTNCGQYYQCTAEKTVTITFIFYTINFYTYISAFCLHMR